MSKEASAELRKCLESFVFQVNDIDWQSPYGPGKWRRIEVLGHLVDSAANNHLRFVRALLEEELAGSKYDQLGCVRVQAYASYPADQLVALWVSYNLLLCHVMDQIPDSKRNTVCRIGENEPVSLDFLVTDYVSHLKAHLAQITGD
ncbi:DinB family protein [Bryobacter aggregatus]|uniref:DinB family protein n=1 Tax=Bryobacter aggregatus TaxID=360054 RepID=UPI00068DE830|nr:DinB family protein [Bryobacter aggregatus]